MGPFVSLLLIGPALGRFFPPCTTPGCVDHAFDMSEDDLLMVSQGASVTWVVVFYTSLSPGWQHYSSEFKRIAGNFVGLENSIKFGGYDCAMLSGCSDYGADFSPVVKTFSKHSSSIARTVDDEGFRGTKVSARAEHDLSAHVQGLFHSGVHTVPGGALTGDEDAQTLELGDRGAVLDNLTFFYIPISTSFLVIGFIVVYFTSSVRPRMAFVHTVLRCLHVGKASRQALSPRTRLTHFARMRSALMSPRYGSREQNPAACFSWFEQDPAVQCIWLEQEPRNPEGRSIATHRLDKLLHIFSLGEDNEDSQFYRSLV